MRKGVFVLPLALLACGLSVAGSNREPQPIVDGGLVNPVPTATSGVDAQSSTPGVDSSAPADAQPDTNIEINCPTNEPACGGACCAGLCAANACKIPELWLKADEGVTTNPFVWADQSGHKRNLSQTSASLSPSVAPGVLANRQVVRFSDNQRLEGPDIQGFQIGSGDFAWFHVSRGSGNNTAKNQVFGTIRNAPGFRGMTAGYGNNDRPYALIREGDGNEITLEGSNTNNWNVVDLRRLGGTAQFRNNGAIIAAAVSTHNVSGGNIMVGVERAEGAEFLAGDIAEILIFRGAFSDDERTAVLRYLATRHQLNVIQ